MFIGLETPSREALAGAMKEQNNRADALATVGSVYAHGIDVYASFIVGFDSDDTTIFDRQREFIRRSGIVVASLGLLLALPRTPLYARLQRDGRLKPTAGDRHRLWNNLVATNVIPLRMSEAELLYGFRDLMASVADDKAIADRIRTKLRQFGRPPLTFGLTPGRVFIYLVRFLLFGLLPGGPRRWYHVARSLVPAMRRPRLLPFAILNWTYGLSIRAFVREHVRSTPDIDAAAAEACSILECPAA